MKKPCLHFIFLMISVETDLNKSETYFCIPFKCISVYICLYLVVVIFE